jgi:hypothetical protein
MSTRKSPMIDFALAIKGHHGLGNSRGFFFGIKPLLFNPGSGFKKVKGFEIIGVVQLGDGVTWH